MPPAPSRFHLAWDDTLEAFTSTHIGLDRPDERAISRTTSIETVEWLLPGWRVLSRHKSATVLTWRDSTNMTWLTSGGQEPTPQTGRCEHMLLARDTPTSLTSHVLPADAPRPPRPPAAPGTTDWMLLSLPTTAARPYFRTWGNPPHRKWNFADWEPHERVWTVQFALRTANIGATPLALAETLCLSYEHQPIGADAQKWWPLPHQVKALQLALTGRTGSGNHPTGASRKTALARHAPTLTATRTLIALGAVRDWDAITQP